MMVSFGVGIFINPKYSPAGIIAGLIIRKHRITSYNVCYTKLLRKVLIFLSKLTMAIPTALTAKRLT